MKTANNKQFIAEYNKFYTTNTEKLVKQLLKNANKYCIFCIDDAEEIVEESMVELYEQIANQEDADFMSMLTYPLIYTICSRKACKRVSNPWVVMTDSLYKTINNEDEKLEISQKVEESAKVLDSEEYVDDEYKREIAKECIAELSDKKLLLITGFYIEKKSFAELAEELGYRDASVAKTAKCRVMKELATQVEERLAKYRKNQRLDIFGREAA